MIYTSLNITFLIHAITSCIYLSWGSGWLNSGNSEIFGQNHFHDTFFLHTSIICMLVHEKGVFNIITSITKIIYFFHYLMSATYVFMQALKTCQLTDFNFPGFIFVPIAAPIYIPVIIPNKSFWKIYSQ